MLKSVLITLIMWLLTIPIMIILMTVFSITYLLTVLFDKNRIVLHYITCFWGSLFTYINPWWKVRIIDRQKLNNSKSYIIISNHQSLLDILVLYRLYAPYKWISKAELFKVPVLGWVLSMNNYVKIKRGDKQSALKMYDSAKKHVDSGMSLMIFPEGTRSEDGQIKKFKEGAFRLAFETKTNLLPVIISGASEALPKKGFWLKKKQTIKVKILDEIVYDLFKTKPLQNLIEETNRKMTDELKILTN